MENRKIQMRAGGLQFRIGRAIAAAVLVLSTLVTLTACAANSYAGIPLSPGAADADLQQLARRAQAGDKHAQLELGIRYEEGRGVPVDLKRAEKLYRVAATTTGGTRLIYVPAVGRNPTSVIPLSQGPMQPGLPEARRRLGRMEGRSTEFHKDSAK